MLYQYTFKYSLQDNKITLCAEIVLWSSPTNVTSLNSELVLSLLKLLTAFNLKSFQLSENFLTLCVAD